jgi:CBS domain-containing protein
MQEDTIESIHAPLAQLVRRPPVACAPDLKVVEALRIMRDSSIGSIIVISPERIPLGILTLRDVTDRVALEPGALEAPIARVMTPQPITLPLQATGDSAALMMIRKGVRHIVLVEGGRLAGIVSERDLFGLQGSGIRQVSTAIRNAGDVHALEHCGHDISALARKMLAQGMAIGPLTVFIASLNDLLAERIIELEFRDSECAGVRYCWILLGSEGRSEQTLVTDQDNGIIFAPPPGEDAIETRRRLLPVARRINQALDRAGYKLCAGDIMAGNPSWCLSLEEWRGRFGRWIDSGDPEALLNSAIFFDLRPLHGDASLSQELRHWLLEHASGSPRFLHLMAGNALKNRAPLGLLSDFSPDEDGRINLKLNGATPFVDAARIFSLAYRIDETHTERRLRATGTGLRVPAREIEAWIAAYHHVQHARFKAQLDSLAQGVAPDNRIDPELLNDFDRQSLKLAFQQARQLQKRLALDYGL